jgi:hypothetical protein
MLRIPETGYQRVNSEQQKVDYLDD